MSKDEEQLNSESEQEESEDIASQNDEIEDTNSESSADDSDKGQEAPDLEKQNKQLYARTNKAESELKKLRAQMEVYKKSKPQSEDIDPFETVKTLNALKNFQDEKELEIVRRQARALEVPLAEAASHEDTQLLVESYRKKQENANATPEPSSRRSPRDKSFSEYSPDDINSLADDGSDDAMAKLDEYYKWAKQN